MGGVCARGALRVCVPPRLPRARLAWARSSASACRHGCGDDFSLPGAPRAAGRRRARVPAAVRRSPARGAPPSAISLMSGLHVMRHRHCTPRAPAARSRGSSCHSERTEPSSQTEVQRRGCPWTSLHELRAHRLSTHTKSSLAAPPLGTATSLMLRLLGRRRAHGLRGRCSAEVYSGVGAARVTRASAARTPGGPGDRRMRSAPRASDPHGLCGRKLLPSVYMPLAPASPGFEWWQQQSSPTR